MAFLPAVPAGFLASEVKRCSKCLEELPPSVGSGVATTLNRREAGKCMGPAGWPSALRPKHTGHCNGNFEKRLPLLIAQLLTLGQVGSTLLGLVLALFWGHIGRQNP